MFMHTSGCDIFPSLSLSLLDRLCMAPKVRKSTPGQNPLQSSGSFSSSDPLPPFHVWFHDEKACWDFLENF